MSIALVVAAASYALVRYNNRDRGATTAVRWALDDINQIPDSVITDLFALDQWRDQSRLFSERVLSGQMPVDSIRAFYHLYADCARAGILSADDVIQLSRFMDLSRVGRRALGAEIRQPTDSL